MTASPDVLVVGAGIIGAACALRLTEEGMSVAVVDRPRPAGGTTAAAMGQITVMDDSDAQGALTLWSQELWDALAPSLSAIEHDPCGTLWVATNDEELDEARKKEQWYAAHGIESSLLHPGALREAEPHLNEDLVGALHVPGDSVVYPPNAALSMLEHAVRAGATVTTGCEVRSVDASHAVLADGSRLHAGAVVCAAGNHTLGLLPRPIPGAAIRPRKGHLAITERYPGLLRHQVVELGYLRSAHGHEDVSVAFNGQPRTTDQVLIGSSRQYDRTSDNVEPDVLARMLARACRFIPALATCSVVRCWTGFRPATPDNLPLVGPAPDAEGLWLAAGHEGLGITTSLGTAQLITDGILGRPSAIDAAPYLPDRFAEDNHE